VELRSLNFTFRASPSLLLLPSFGGSTTSLEVFDAGIVPLELLVIYLTILVISGGDAKDGLERQFTTRLLKLCMFIGTCTGTGLANVKADSMWTQCCTRDCGIDQTTTLTSPCLSVSCIRCAEPQRLRRDRLLRMNTMRGTSFRGSG
jgi:hypothetical protein